MYLGADETVHQIPKKNKFKKKFFEVHVPFLFAHYYHLNPFMWRFREEKSPINARKLQYITKICLISE